MTHDYESSMRCHEELTDANVVCILDGLLKEIVFGTMTTAPKTQNYDTTIKPVFIQALFRAMQIVIEASGCEQELNPAILKDEKSLERFLASDLTKTSV